MLPHPIFYYLTAIYNSILPTSLIHISKEMFNLYTFEKLDMHILAQRRAFATSIGDLFPGAHGKDSLKNVVIQVRDNVEYEQETEFYITGSKANPIVASPDEPISVEYGTVKNEKVTFVFHAKDDQLLIDGRLFITGLKNENIVCFLQYKYSADTDVDKEEQMNISPLAWYDAIAPEIKKQYTDYLVVFVYITNAKIPKKAKEAVEKCQNLLVVEQTCVQDYFAPNILPIYSTVQGQEKDDDDAEPANSSMSKLQSDR